MYRRLAPHHFGDSRDSGGGLGMLLSLSLTTTEGSVGLESPRFGTGAFGAGVGMRLSTTVEEFD